MIYCVIAIKYETSLALWCSDYVAGGLPLAAASNYEGSTSTRMEPVSHVGNQGQHATINPPAAGYAPVPTAPLPSEMDYFHNTRPHTVYPTETETGPSDSASRSGQPQSGPDAEPPPAYDEALHFPRPSAPPSQSAP